jgi:ubiquinone/menaquinone biosynthesis C-methylase UbiE
MLDYAYEFQRESRRIDQLIWDAMSLVRGERVLFCGFANDGLWVKRAAEIGVDVSVIESDEAKLAELQGLGIATLRGSTTLIPARDNSFDAIVAFHYLHEIDPTFHTQIIWELARVGKRIVIVEPAPPADALGKRISELYSRAKYEAGAFEEYRSIDYWRKLLAMVKADVLMQQFTFTRLAPRFAVEETVGLILSAMEVEQMPQAYLEELRELARSPESQLSPLSRFVLVALGAGEPVRASAGTLFREETFEEQEQRLTLAAAMAPKAPVTPAAPGVRGPAPVAPPPAYAASMPGAEFPPVLPPPGAAPLPVAPRAAPPPAGLPPAAQPPAGVPPVPAAAPFAPAAAAPAQPQAPQPVPPQPVPPTPAPAPFGMPAAPAAAPFGMPAGPEPAFGIPDPAPFGVPPPAGRPAPFGQPFALPEDPDPFGLSPDPEERAGFGWNWEPPEGHPDAQPGDEPFGR